MSPAKAVQDQVVLVLLREHQLVQMGSSSSKAREAPEEIILSTTRMPVPKIINIRTEHSQVKPKPLPTR